MAARKPAARRSAARRSVSRRSVSRRSVSRRSVSRRPAARRPPRRSARRRQQDETLVIVLIGFVVVIAVFLAVLRFLASHAVVTLLVVLAVGVAAGLVARSRIQAAAERRAVWAARAQHIGSYLTMSPDEFERALAYLCERDGCTQVRVVGGAGDLGADVIGTTPTGHRIVIQAKRYGPTNKVGSPELQKVGGTARQVHGAQLVVAVTTSSFTRAAREYAAHPGVAIRLFDHDALAGWASRTGPAPWH
jgi:restriction system protein